MFQDAFQVLVLCFGVESDFFQRCNASLDITSYQLCMYCWKCRLYILLTYVFWNLFGKILIFQWCTCDLSTHEIVSYCKVSCSSSEFFTRAKETPRTVVRVSLCIPSNIEWRQITRWRNLLANATIQRNCSSAFPDMTIL